LKCGIELGGREICGGCGAGQKAPAETAFEHAAHERDAANEAEKQADQSWREEHRHVVALEADLAKVQEAAQGVIAAVNEEVPHAESP
jgi:hypothetical protein